MKVYTSVFTAGVSELCEVALWSEWHVLNSGGITRGVKNSLVVRERTWAVPSPCLYSLYLHCPASLHSWGSPRQMWALLILLCPHCFITQVCVFRDIFHSCLCWGVLKLLLVLSWEDPSVIWGQIVQTAEFNHCGRELNLFSCFKTCIKVWPDTSSHKG